MTIKSAQIPSEEVLRPLSRFLKMTGQSMHRGAQCASDFDQRIHGWRFDPTFNATDKDGGKTGFFGQPFLTQTSTLSIASDSFPQKTAMFDDGHSRSADRKPSKASMSLTPSFACMIFGSMIKTETLVQLGGILLGNFKR